MAGDDNYLHTSNQVNSPPAVLPLFVQLSNKSEICLSEGGKYLVIMRKYLVIISCSPDPGQDRVMVLIGLLPERFPPQRLIKLIT